MLDSNRKSLIRERSRSNEEDSISGWIEVAQQRRVSAAAGATETCRNRVDGFEEAAC